MRSIQHTRSQHRRSRPARQQPAPPRCCWGWRLLPRPAAPGRHQALTLHSLLVPRPRTGPRAALAAALQALAGPRAAREWSGSCTRLSRRQAARWQRAHSAACLLRAKAIVTSDDGAQACTLRPCVQPYVQRALCMYCRSMGARRGAASVAKKCKTNLSCWCMADEDRRVMQRRTHHCRTDLGREDVTVRLQGRRGEGGCASVRPRCCSGPRARMR